jgi:hypothetical protein
VPVVPGPASQAGPDEIRHPAHELSTAPGYAMLRSAAHLVSKMNQVLAGLSLDRDRIVYLDAEGSLSRRSRRRPPAPPNRSRDSRRCGNSWAGFGPGRAVSKERLIASIVPDPDDLTPAAGGEEAFRRQWSAAIHIGAERETRKAAKLTAPNSSIGALDHRQACPNTQMGKAITVTRPSLVRSNTFPTGVFNQQRRGPCGPGIRW